MSRERVSVLPKQLLAAAVGVAVGSTIRLGAIAKTGLSSAGRSFGILTAEQGSDTALASPLLPDADETSMTVISTATLGRGCSRVKTLSPDEFEEFIRGLSGAPSAGRVQSLFFSDFMLPSIILQTFEEKQDLQLLYVPMIIRYVRTMKINEHSEDFYIMTPFASFEAHRETIGFSARSGLHNGLIARELMQCEPEKMCVVINYDRLEPEIQEALAEWFADQLSISHIRGDRSDTEYAELVGTHRGDKPVEYRGDKIPLNPL